MRCGCSPISPTRWSSELGQRRTDLGVAELRVWIGPAPPHSALDRERRPVVVPDAFDVDLDRDDALGHERIVEHPRAAVGSDCDALAHDRKRHPWVGAQTGQRVTARSEPDQRAAGPARTAAETGIACGGWPAVVRIVTVPGGHSGSTP